MSRDGPLSTPLTLFTLVRAGTTKPKLKIGINGFGRIGRLVMRTTLERDDVEVVAVNDPFISADYMAYMFKYDTVHGRLPGTAAAAHDQECKPDATCPDVLLVNGRTVRVFNSKDPAQIPWGKVGADFVIESTGVFTDVAKSSAHFTGGAKKVRSSHAYGDVDRLHADHVPAGLLFTSGHYHRPVPRCPHVCDGRQRRPVQAGHARGQQRQLHHQLPGAAGQGHRRGLRHRAGPYDHGAQHHRHPEDRGRPLRQGLARRPLRLRQHHSQLHWRGQGCGQRPAPPEGQAHGHGLPRPDGGCERRRPDRAAEEAGVLQGCATPAPSWSTTQCADEHCFLHCSPPDTEICATIKAASESDELRGILGYTDAPVVSSDFIHDSHSSIFDAEAGIALTPNFVKLVSWYDNEWGYSQRVVDLAIHMAKVDAAAGVAR